MNSISVFLRQRALMGMCLLSGLLGLNVLVGCALADTPRVPTTAPASAVRVEPITWGSFKEAYRISNADAEIVVVPEVGRIVSYKLGTRRNVLWTTDGVDPRPRNQKWLNYGGEKAWIWPQAEWPKIINSQWPPPPGMEGPGDVSVIENGVRWTTAGVPGFGARVSREITLAASGSRVTTTTWLEPAPDTSRAVDVPVAPWVVVQVPATDFVLARRAGARTMEAGWKPMSATQFKSVAPVGDDVLVIRRSRDMSPKIGIEGDLLAAVYEDLMVVVRDVSEPTNGPQPVERAQLYSGPDPTDSALPAYMELEFITAGKPATERNAAKLKLTYDIIPVTPPVDGKKTNEWLAGLLKGL